MPPVTFCPAISFSFTGFQIFDPAGAFHAGPYFHVVMSNGPWFTAPGGATLFALLSCPAFAASGKLPPVATASSVALGCSRCCCCALCGHGCERDDCRNGGRKEFLLHSGLLRLCTLLPRTKRIRLFPAST